VEAKGKELVDEDESRSLQDDCLASASNRVAGALAGPFRPRGRTRG
jgi:hypothetical protein